MIPREILKKIRQIEIRTNRIVTEAAAEWRSSGPDGLRFGIGAGAESHFEGKMRPVSPSEAQKGRFLVKNRCSDEFNRGSERSNRCSEQSNRGWKRSNCYWEEINRCSASSNRSWIQSNRRWVEFSRSSEVVGRNAKACGWNWGAGVPHFLPS